MYFGLHWVFIAARGLYSAIFYSLIFPFMPTNFLDTYGLTHVDRWGWWGTVIE